MIFPFIFDLWFRRFRLQACSRQLLARSPKRRTCATQWAPIGSGEGYAPQGCQRATVPPTLFPGASRGIRWRPNVPSHGQRDRDSISDCRSWLKGRWCLSPGWANAGSQRPTMPDCDHSSRVGRRRVQPQAILHPAPLAEVAQPRSCSF
jgi:hypothetical protein